jgi:dTMP kinase
MGSNRDRIEREDDGFREEVALAYRQLAETFPERIEVVDASRSAAETAKEIFERVRDSL